MLERIKQGDRNAINRMIEANIPFVTTLLAESLKAHPESYYLHDDLLSAGYEQLAIAINSITPESAFETPECITAFLRGHIKGAFIEVVYRDPAIRIPRRTFSERKAQGKPIAPLVRKTLANIERHNLDKDGEVDPRDILIVWGELNASCIDDTDRTIIRMRAKQHTDDEIAEYLGIGKTQVYTRRKAIQARYEKRQKRG